MIIMNDIHYLDNAATQPTAFWNSYYSDFLMNSNTNYATAEKKALEKARNTIKEQLKVKSGYVLFGGGATMLIQNLFEIIKNNT